MGWTVETVSAVEAEIKALPVKLSARLVRLRCMPFTEPTSGGLSSTALRNILISDPRMLVRTSTM